jgi:flagellar biosynthesis chaperone FliJ
VQHEPSSSSIMTTYIGAVNEFTKNATAFIEQLPLLTKARDAYKQAMRASGELRKVLDAGEENLQTLMTQLEHGVSIQRVNLAPDKKNPEPAKLERMRVTDEGRANKWP